MADEPSKCQCGEPPSYDSALLPDSDDVGTCIICLSCKSEGPLKETLEEAVEAWNKGERVNG